MSNNINVINSDIVDAGYDVYWEDVSPLTNGAVPKPVLVITGSYQEDSEEQKQLLKMLEACKLRAEQYNIIQIGSGQRAAWHKLQQQLDPKIVFLIGILPVNLGISASFKLNEPNNFSGCVWLPTLSIKELGEDKDAKAQLWNNGMKPVFIGNPLLTP
jgi:hypothetical protein